MKNPGVYCEPPQQQQEEMSRQTMDMTRKRQRNVRKIRLIQHERSKEGQTSTTGSKPRKRLHASHVCKVWEELTWNEVLVTKVMDGKGRVTTVCCWEGWE